MGLDQYLYEIQPDVYEPGSNSGEQIAYWGKDWQLQEFINTGNCEELVVTESLCQSILSSLNEIYTENDVYGRDEQKLKIHTEQAFTKALELIQSGKGVMYDANW